MPPRINANSKRQYIKNLEDKFSDIYDYSLANYKGFSKKIKIIDKETQIVFEQRYDYHAQGKPSSTLEYNFINYIKKCNKKYNSRFKYSLYKGYNKQVTVYDTLLNRTYTQIAQEHYEGSPIPIIFKELLNDFDVFKRRAVKVHGDIFDYLTYDWDNRKVTFKHKLSGFVYTQRVYEHIDGCLPKEMSLQSVSKGEKKLRENLKEIFNDLKIEFNVRPPWLGGKELDIYIPSLRLAFEFNGSFCHHSNYDIKDSFARERVKPFDYHLNKFNVCLQNGVKLIHIFDFENYDLKSLVNLYLFSKLEVVENKPFYLNKRLEVIDEEQEDPVYIIYKPILSFIQLPS